MRFTNREAILITMELVLCALWAVCFVRASHFYSEASAVFAATGSGDAYTDFGFSQVILFCYCISSVVGFVLVWWACYCSHLLFWFLAGCAYFIVAFVVFARPEEVIVFFPSLVPLIACLGSVVLAIVAGIGKVVMRRVSE